MKSYKLISLVLLILGIAAFLATKIYTKVNATSTALLIILIMIPCLVLEGFFYNHFL